MYLLLKLVREHPAMRDVVSKEVRQLLSRSEMPIRGIYYGVSFLNQIEFTSKDSNLAGSLIMFYFSLFKKYTVLTLDELKAYGMIGDEGRLYEELYNEVRRECIYKYMERIYHGCDTPEDDMMLALLITRRNPTEMTDAFIRNLTEKYRRKSDVSSHRRTEND